MGTFEHKDSLDDPGTRVIGQNAFSFLQCQKKADTLPRSIRSIVWRHSNQPPVD
jgi:hypothetical protein